MRLTYAYVVVCIFDDKVWRQLHACPTLESKSSWPITKKVYVIVYVDCGDIYQSCHVWNFLKLT